MKEIFKKAETDSASASRSLEYIKLAKSSSKPSFTIYLSSDGKIAINQTSRLFATGGREI